MNVTTLIDQIVGHVDNLPTTDTDLADLRLEILENLIEVVSFVQGRRPLKARFTTQTVITSSGSASLGADFEHIPAFGGVFLSSNGQRLTYVDPSVIIQKRAQGVLSDSPTEYSLFGFHATDFQHLIQVAGGTVSLLVGYIQGLPTLNEATEVENLNVIPARWHQSVLVPGVRAMREYDKGDGRATQHFSLDPGFAAGLRQMLNAERGGREGSRQFPSFFGA